MKSIGRPRREASSADLSTSDAEGLIGQLAELGRRQPMMPVLVFSGGEPFCRADLFDLIGEARRRGIVSALATNGTLIDSQRARQIHESGIARVSISLDGATAAVHDSIRQIPGAFDRALEGINHLHEASVAFQVNITLTKENAGQLEDVYKLALSRGAVALHLFMLVPVGCGRVLAETDMLSPLQYEEILWEVAATGDYLAEEPFCAYVAPAARRELPETPVKRTQS